MLCMVLSELSSHRRRVSGDSPLAIRIVKAFLWGALMGGQRGSGVAYGSDGTFFPPHMGFG